MDVFEFCFREDRDYVHGPDIYDTVASYLQQRYPGRIGQLDLWMHKMSSYNMEGYVLSADEPAPSEYSAVCKFQTAGSFQTLYLFETDSPIECRLPYDEENIVGSAQLTAETKSIWLEERVPFTVAQIAVALNKALLQELYERPAGKWIFNRLRLKRLLPENYDSRVAVSFDVGFGLHLLRSGITVDDVKYGEIFFSLVRGQ